MKQIKKSLYDDLKRQIMLLEREPGSYIEESSLAELYSMSRTPVREVLRCLTGEGYLILEDKMGARIAPLTHSTLRNFYQIAPMIYAAVGRLAAENRNISQLNALKSCQKQFVKACKNADIAERVYLNNQFHEIIGDMSGSPYLQVSLKRLLIDHARIGRLFFNPPEEKTGSKLANAIHQHEGMIEAIGKRYAEAVVNLTHEHWQLSRDDLLTFFPAQGLNEQDLQVRSLLANIPN